MIRKIINTCVIAAATFSLLSCSTDMYSAQSSKDTAYYLLDSLQCADMVPFIEPPIIAEEDMPVVETEPTPHYEAIYFDSEQSSRVLLAEYRDLLEEDLAFDYKTLKDNFRFPLDSGYVTSPYGWRRGRMHAGIDIKAYKGDNIYAVFDGVVRMSKYYTAFGNCVVIHHYNGFETLYSHASKLLVKVNDVVKAGDVIALAGRTGRATGDHLHFELRYMGQHMNPALLLDVKNLTMQEKSIYLSMRSGRVFASNEDSLEARETEIKEATSIKYHTVRSGDTLSRIARNNGTTVSALCRTNKITSTSILRLGQRIRVR
ncbi:MAG: M23 family metallopeptidase [Rikenellaceae bacterium]